MTEVTVKQTIQTTFGRKRIKTMLTYSFVRSLLVLLVAVLMGTAVNFVQDGFLLVFEFLSIFICTIIECVNALLRDLKEVNEFGEVKDYDNHPEILSFRQ